MFSYIIRRTLYAVPILFGVVVISFFLFYVVHTPKMMAYQMLGPKAKPLEINNWLHDRGFDKPTFFNTEPGHKFYDSQFFYYVKSLMVFDLGKSLKTNEPIIDMFKRGAVPSLLITLPAFIVGLLTAVMAAMFLVFISESLLDVTGTIICVMSMSIPIMAYVIYGQLLFATEWKYFPAFGFIPGGFSMLRFLILPICIMAFVGIGSDIRMYRAIFIEEARHDYIRTAYAKGLSSRRVLLTHLFKNGLISMITLIVTSLPGLIIGNIVVENFFGIPGLGNMAINAIQSADFTVIMADVYVGSLMFLVGLLLTDICYAIAESADQVELIMKLLVLVLQDLGVLAVIAGIVFGIYTFSRNDRWHRALRRFYRDKFGVAMMGIILVYFAVGVSDMIKLPLQDTSGRYISFLDLCFRNVPREKNFSAPLARTTYSLNDAKPLKGWHLLGTDQLGNDVLKETMKGCSTAILIGSITSAIYIPIGIVLGILAGYYRGKTDDLIQYIYSTVSSIPGILLLISLLMILGKGALQISFALGITGWIGLCRLLRGETFKQSRSAYCEAARALGQSDFNIIFRHILPNVMHLVFISFVLGFSGIVMTEALLSYLTVGMPIGSASWGLMIDLARMELSREPMVWWDLGSAVFALFFLVLSLNLLGDSVRRAFDPRAA